MKRSIRLGSTVAGRSLVCLFLGWVGLGAGFAEGLKFAEPRPMMRLAGELVSRYDYLVTYEDAPVEASDVVARTVAGGHEFRHPRWAPITFHVQARVVVDSASPGTSQPGTSDSKFADSPAAIRPLGPDVIRPLIAEYNASGNPGRFDAIFDGAYAHIVPAGREGGRGTDSFQPMLSTVVPVNVSEGTCWGLLNELFSEVHHSRQIPIGIFLAPVTPMSSKLCTIHGHDLPARQVLVELLDEIGANGGRGTPARFAWTLVYDPTSAGYVFCTLMVQAEPPHVPPQVLTLTPNEVPASGSILTMPSPAKKQ